MKTEVFCTLIAVAIIRVKSTQNSEKYTTKETEALKLFLPAVSNVLYMDYQRSDAYLINWLRSKHLDIPSAAQALKMSIKFRRENNVDHIPNSEAMLDLQKHLPTDFGSILDKEGNPTALLVFSKWDIRRAVLAGKNEELKRYAVFVYESITQVMRNLNATSWILLNDMSNFSIRKHACIACLPFYAEVPTIYETHYPNTAKYLIGVNTPRVFETPLNIILSVLSPETKKAFKMFGLDKTEWQEYLLKIFPAAQLPTQYGGTRIMN